MQERENSKLEAEKKIKTKKTETGEQTEDRKD